MMCDDNWYDPFLFSLNYSRHVCVYSYTQVSIIFVGPVPANYAAVCRNPHNPNSNVYPYHGL